MVVGQVQPDAKKLGKQTSVTSANSALSFASGAFGLSDVSRGLQYLADHQFVMLDNPLPPHFPSLIRIVFLFLNIHMTILFLFALTLATQNPLNAHNPLNS